MINNSLLQLRLASKQSGLRSIPVFYQTLLKFSTVNSRVLNEQSQSVFDKKEIPVSAEENKDAVKEPFELKTFQQLKDHNLVDPLISKALARTGFPNLTPVQSKTLTPILEKIDHDIIARAKTGTGKTLAFLIPIFEHLCKTRRENQYMVKSVIVAPTRDLALQIEDEIKKVFYKNNYGLEKFPSMSLIGGIKLGDQVRKMRKLRPNVVVCTPGRLMDFLSDDRLASQHFKYVDFKIFDEADRLLEIGFKEDMEKISDTLNSISALPPNHIRTLLFSATFSKEVKSLSRTIMNKKDSTFIDTVDKNEPEVQEKINQKLVVLDSTEKQILESLKYFTEKVVNKENGKYIVFVPVTTLTTTMANMFRNVLRQNNLFSQATVHVLHGKLQQDRRTKTVQRFKKSDDRTVNFLFCTDVGARGMDYPNITEVVQIGLPSETANYIHRIGRTARGSSDKGESIAFVTKSEHPFFDVLAREKKVFVNDKIKNFDEYVDKFDVKEIVKNNMENEFDTWNETFYSLLGFHRSSTSEFRTNMIDLAKDCCISFEKLCGKKLHVQPSSINRIFGNQVLRKISDYIDYDGPLPTENTRSRFGGSSRSRFNRFDRDGENTRDNDEFKPRNFSDRRPRNDNNRNFSSGNRRNNSESYGGQERRNNYNSYGQDRRSNNNDSYGQDKRKNNYSRNFDRKDLD